MQVVFLVPLSGGAIFVLMLIAFIEAMTTETYHERTARLAREADAARVRSLTRQTESERRIKRVHAMMLRLRIRTYRQQQIDRAAKRAFAELVPSIRRLWLARRVGTSLLFWSAAFFFLINLTLYGAVLAAAYAKARTLLGD
jgi:hypothetical protein